MEVPVCFFCRSISCARVIHKCLLPPFPQETRAPPLRAPRPPVKPFILTRDAAQAKYSAVIELGGGASGACLVLATLEMTLRWWPLHPRPCSPCDPDSPSSVHVSMCNSDLLFFGRVFGAGYPGLATMSVDEWYEQHRKRGVLPDQGLPRAAPGNGHRSRTRGGGWKGHGGLLVCQSQSPPLQAGSITCHAGGILGLICKIKSGLLGSGSGMCSGVLKAAKCDMCSSSDLFIYFM